MARRVGAGGYLETFLVSAVTAVLAIRAALQATGYPQVGGGGLHIAHMLWGGLLMLAALVVLLAFLGAQSRRLAAVVGGIGFGTFIDELGKFVTSDNDYFYKPTVGVLYVLFVLLFLTARAIERRRPFSPAEALANAADSLRELVLGGATPTERARTLALLEASGATGALAGAMRAVVAAAAPSADVSPSAPARLAARGRRTYHRLIAWRWFGRAVILVFLLNAVLGLVAVVAVGAALLVGLVVGIAVPEARAELTAELLGEAGTTPAEWVAALAALAASLASLCCAVVGVGRLRADRLTALRWFKRSVLLSLLLVQPFEFFADEFGALGGLGVQLVLLVGATYLLGQEAARRRDARSLATARRRRRSART